MRLAGDNAVKGLKNLYRVKFEKITKTFLGQHVVHIHLPGPAKEIAILMQDPDITESTLVAGVKRIQVDHWASMHLDHPDRDKQWCPDAARIPIVFVAAPFPAMAVWLARGIRRFAFADAYLTYFSTATAKDEHVRQRVRDLGLNNLRVPLQSWIWFPQKQDGRRKPMASWKSFKKAKLWSTDVCYFCYFVVPHA